MMNTRTQKYLDAIFSSKEFVNSESSKRLLAYLVEQSFKNHIPKEIDIAIAVFGRDASYDSSSDSLVRSHIYSLRNKLEKYYLTEGKSDKSRLVIPKGHYEVVFTESPSEKSRSGRTRRTIVLAIFGLLVLCLAVLFLVNQFFVLKSRNTALHQDLLPDIPWAAFKNSEKQVLLVIGDFFVYVHRKNDEYGNRRIRNGRVNSLEELMEYYEKYPTEKLDFSGLTQTYISPPVIEAAMTLIPSFVQAGMTIKFAHASQLTSKDLENFNIVFVGPLKTLRLLEPYFNMSRFEFDFYPHILTFEDKSDTKNLNVLDVEIEDGLQYRKDYGFLIQVPGPADNIIMIITAFSTNSLPTLSQILHSGELETGIDSRQRTSFPQYFEALYQIDIISDTSVYNLLNFKEIHFKPTS